MSEYDKGFNDAVNKIINYAKEQAGSYAILHFEFDKLGIKTKEMHYKALAITDFKLLIEQLFNRYAVESDNK